MLEQSDGTPGRASLAAPTLLGCSARVDWSEARLARWLALAGIWSVAAAIGGIGLLHVIAPSRTLNPMQRTISEYALLPDGWVFDLGVMVLAVGSAAVIAALMIQGMLPRRSRSALFLSTWCIGLAGLVLFPKHGFGADTTVAGRVHWSWTLIAFFSLPIGTAMLFRARRIGLPESRWPGWAIRLSVVAGGWFVVLAGQTVASVVDPNRMWPIVGLVERGLSLTEMVTVWVLARWVLADGRRVPDSAVDLGTPDTEPPGPARRTESPTCMRSAGR